MVAWEVKSSPALNGWGAAIRETQDALHTPVGLLVGSLGGGPSNHVATSKALRVVAVWWWLLPAAHVPRWAGLIVSASLMALGVRLLWGCVPCGKSFARNDAARLASIPRKG
jgi:hypothetical protein